MAKKRKRHKLTPEDEAAFERRSQLIRERIAWREARERELEATRERADKA